MSVTLTDEQAAALTRVMDRHERHHFDGVCTSNGLQDDCAACGDIAVVRDALTSEPAPCPHREQLIKARHLLIAYRMQCHCDRDGVEWRCAACRKSIEGGLAVEEAIEQPCAAPGDCKHREIARKLCQRLHTVECGVECTDLCRDAYRRIDRACAPGEAGSPPMPWGEMAYWLGKSLEVYSGNDVLAEPAQQIIDWMQAEARRRAPGEAGDGWELVGDHAVENLTALASMGACWQPGYRVRVYRRRELAGGAR